VIKIQKKIVGGSCSMYGRGEVYSWYWWGSLSEKDHLEELGLDEEIILKWIIRNWFERMYWIDVAHSRDSRWDLVNAVMNITVSKIARNS